MFDSLFVTGALLRVGSLRDFGALGIPGSLFLCGAVSGRGSLTRDGALVFDGSLLAVAAPDADYAGYYVGGGAAYLFDYDGLDWVYREKSDALAPTS